MALSLATPSVARTMISPKDAASAKVPADAFAPSVCDTESWSSPSLDRFADTRAGEKIRVDDYLKKPDPDDQLAACLEEVMRPFTEAREERNRRHQARIARGLTLEQVAALAMDVKAQVSILEAAVNELEADGGEQEP